MRRELAKNLIICCGVTELNYFRALRSDYRTRDVDVKGFSSSPETVIKKILRNKIQNDYKKLFIICDKDDFELAKAYQVLQREGISNVEIIFSNPCFELWLLLHFKFVNSELSSGNCLDKIKDAFLRELRYRYRKNDALIYNRIKDRQKIAIANGKKLFETKKGLKLDFDKNNPLTMVFDLVKKFKSH